MESFYGQMKTETMDIIAPSPTFKVSIDIEAFSFAKITYPLIRYSSFNNSILKMTGRIPLGQQAIR